MAQFVESSDAAFTLRLLNEIFDLKMSEDRLKNYASRMGSDCSFFIEDQPMTGTGRGEILSPIAVNLKIFIWSWLIRIFTSQRQTLIQGSNGASWKFHSAYFKTSMERMEKQTFHDFEKSIFKKHSTIKKIKENCIPLVQVTRAWADRGQVCLAFLINLLI